ncbi:MAG: YggT family protein [Planctomycetes bacterium]|nr:YggT family protein [Planctomycetota bacterium]
MPAVLGLLLTLIRVCEIVLLVRIILSWVPHDPHNAVVRFIQQITDPLLEPARRLIPPMGGLDISPILVFLLLEVLRRVLLGGI